MRSKAKFIFFFDFCQVLFSMHKTTPEGGRLRLVDVVWYIRNAYGVHICFCRDQCGYDSEGGERFFQCDGNSGNEALH